MQLVQKLCAENCDLVLLQKLANRFYSLVKDDLIPLFSDLRSLQCDHLCFRVASQDEYFLLKSALLQKNELLSEANIRGRPIATFRLQRALRFGAHSVQLLELPAPKSGEIYETGFEHAEFVINEPFETFKKRHHALSEKFEIRGNLFNPEMILRFNKLSIKFHYKPLDKVIQFEKLPESQKQLIVFDFDGTLVDSVSYINKANKKVLTEFGVNLERIKSIDRFPSTFAAMLAMFDLGHVKELDFAEKWGNEMSKAPIAPFPEVVPLLERIRKAGIAMAIWTARDLRSAKSTVEKLGLEVYFSQIWAFDELYSKPDLVGLSYLAQGRPKELITYVGDSQVDREAAAAFGCRFLWAHEVFSSSGSANDFVDQLSKFNGCDAS